MCKKVVVVFLTSLLVGIPACIIGYYTRWTDYNPQGSWILLQPPARLSRFVSRASTGLEGEDPYTEPVQIVASTADGTLYAVMCQDDGCTWSKLDALPPAPQEVYHWSRSCMDDYQTDPKKPAFPGKVIDCYEAGYVRPVAPRTMYFILLEDGSVGVWSTAIKGFHGDVILSAITGLEWGIAGLLLGALLGVALIMIGRIIGKKRKRPA